MIRQIDNPSPGGVPGGKLVPGSHKRCELGHSHQTFQQRRSVVTKTRNGTRNGTWKGMKNGMEHGTGYGMEHG